MAIRPILCAGGIIEAAKERLNVCYSLGQGWGQRAADAFYLVAGFDKAAKFKKERARPTRTIGDGSSATGALRGLQIHHLFHVRQAGRPRSGVAATHRLIDSIVTPMFRSFVEHDQT